MANNEDYDVADIDIDIDIDYVNNEVNKDECDNRDESWEIDPDDYVQKEWDSSTVNQLLVFYFGVVLSYSEVFV